MRKSFRPPGRARRPLSRDSDQRPPEPPASFLKQSQLEPGERVPQVRPAAVPEDPPASRGREQEAACSSWRMTCRSWPKREQKFSEEIERQGPRRCRARPAPRNELKTKSRRQNPKPSPSRRRNASRVAASAKSASQSCAGRHRPRQEQQQAAEEAERLRQLAQKDEALTELANRRLDAAAKLVQEVEPGDRGGPEGRGRPGSPRRRPQARVGGAPGREP